MDMNGIGQLLNDFSRFINKNIHPLAEFEEGRRALIMANAAKKSLSSKRCSTWS